MTDSAPLKRPDTAPWALLTCAVLTFSGVTLLAPRRAAQAAPPTAAHAAPTPALEGDGDGDELLEHWGDPKYVREERLQMAGMAGGTLILGGALWARRRRRQPAGLPATLPLREFSEDRKAA